MTIPKAILTAALVLAAHAAAGTCKSSGNTGVCSNVMIQYAHFREDGLLEIKLQDRESKESVDTSVVLDAKRVGEFRYNGMYPLVQTALPAKLQVWLSYTIVDGRHSLDDLLIYQPDIAR